MIIRTDKEPLGDILRDFKKFTSKKIMAAIHEINESRREWLLRAFQRSGDKLKRIRKNKVWQDGNHPELLVTNKFLDQKSDYIHNNPVEAEIVDEPEYYWYSSASPDYSSDFLLHD